MSEQIDWSKAPEWAMVLLKHVRDNRYAWAVSHAEESDAWMVERTGFGFRLMKDCWRVVSTRPTTPSWSGEGLPPVGVVCEAGIPHTSGASGENRSIVWIEGRVIAYHEIKGRQYAWFAEDDDGFYPPGVFEFRPIRTPEQIAHDMREAAINEMSRDSNFIGLPNRILLGGLYDAGYRKP